MSPSFSHHPDGLRLPVIGGSPSALVVAVLWLLFACGLPIYQLREVRRQARLDLLHAATADKPDPADLVVAFDRANQGLDAAAFSPCLLLAFTSLLLVNQLSRLKRQYQALAHGLSPTHRR